MKTWTADNKELWLRDFSPEDLATADVDFASCSARIMTFGYDVRVYDKAASQRSETSAEDLLAALRDRRTGGAVCHNPVFCLDVHVGINQVAGTPANRLHWSQHRGNSDQEVQSVLLFTGIYFSVD